MPVYASAPELRSRADQAEILLSFAERLRQHPALSEQSVVISDQSVPTQMPGGGHCLTVSPGPGTFPNELWTGGHHATATEDGSVIVGIYVMNKRDRPGRKESALLGRLWQGSVPAANVFRPSVLGLKRIVLSLLTVDNPDNRQVSQAWEPTKADTVLQKQIPLCRDQIAPARCTAVLDVPGFPGWCGMQITFAVAWDWDLYSKING